MITQTAPQSENTADLRSVHTSNLPALFDHLGISLIVSTYQAGKAIVVRNDDGTLNTHFRTFAKPMGIAVDDTRLTIGGANTVWEYRNIPAVARKLEPAGKHDACYLPRRIHVTGDIDIHELAWDGNTSSGWSTPASAVCAHSTPTTASIRAGGRRSSPPWRRKTAVILNGLAMVDGRPKYVTALGDTDTPGGWRANKANGGVLMDVEPQCNPAPRPLHAALAALVPGQTLALESGEGSWLRSISARHLADRRPAPVSRGASTSSDRWPSSASPRCARAPCSAAFRWSSG